MTGRLVGQAHPDASGMQLTRRRASKDRDPARTERAANRAPAAVEDESHDKLDKDRLERQIQALEAKLAISELERVAERQTSEDTIKSLRAINEELSRSLTLSLDTKPFAALGVPPADRLIERVVRWEASETDWGDTDGSEHSSQPSPTKWLLKVLRAASPL
jgi:hypothetical protein